MLTIAKEAKRKKKSAMSKCITFSGIITFIYICKWTRLYGFSRIKKRQGGEGGQEDTATPRINIKRKPPKSFLPKRKAGGGKLRGLRQCIRRNK